jgi:hypothetical protein
MHLRRQIKMLIVFTLIAAVAGISLILTWIGSARPERDERSYRQNAREEDAWNWGEAPELLIMSTDDHYLHPEQPRADSWSETVDDPTQEQTP